MKSRNVSLCTRHSRCLSVFFAPLNWIFPKCLGETQYSRHGHGVRLKWFGKFETPPKTGKAQIAMNYNSLARWRSVPLGLVLSSQRCAFWIREQGNCFLKKIETVLDDWPAENIHFLNAYQVKLNTRRYTKTGGRRSMGRHRAAIPIKTISVKVFINLGLHHITGENLL